MHISCSLTRCLRPRQPSEATELGRGGIGRHRWPSAQWPLHTKVSEKVGEIKLAKAPYQRTKYTVALRILTRFESNSSLGRTFPAAFKAGRLWGEVAANSIDTQNAPWEGFMPWGWRPELLPTCTQQSQCFNQAELKNKRGSKQPTSTNKRTGSRIEICLWNWWWRLRPSKVQNL